MKQSKESGGIEGHPSSASRAETRSFRRAASSAPGNAAPPGPPPELLGHPRYELLGFVGAGGMGVVYKARHRLMDRVVALKVVNHRLLDRPDMVQRFRREVRAAAQLHHTNIVAAYDAEQAGDCHFLVMEFVQGTNLDELLRAWGLFPVDKACEYARQAARGLQHAHDRGLVHRDIKPHNLMLTPEDTVKVLDFGLARFASEVGLPPPPPAADVTPLADESWAAATMVSHKVRGGEALTGAYSGLGTPDYLAPEEALDARRADIRADVYSLGCTLYRFLTGAVPFPGTDAREKLRAHQQREPVPVDQLRPDVPRALADVVGRMMAKDPARRFATPEEVARALAPFAARRSRRVLVVDDDRPTREAMRQALAGEGYAVDVAEDGGEALALLRGGRPHDLVLLDLFMPRVDGWQFMEERKRDPALAAVPVVVVSAADPDEARSLALGAAAHLRKPLAPEEVAGRVRDHLGSR